MASSEEPHSLKEAPLVVAASVMWKGVPAGIVVSGASFRSCTPAPEKDVFRKRSNERHEAGRAMDVSDVRPRNVWGATPTNSFPVLLACVRSRFVLVPSSITSVM